jgi:creatinine amidohydrolase
MAHNPALVKMEHAAEDRARVPPWRPESFIKKDGVPDVEFDGYDYFVFPTDNGEFSRTGVIGNPLRANTGEGRGGAGPLRRPPRACARRVPITRRAFEERV